MNHIKKKITKIRLVRILLQILFFILVPGLYISAFSGIKQLYLSFYNGDFNMSSLLPQLVALIAVLPVTMLAGRFFCGWMCAFGSLGDFIYGLSKLVIKKRKPIPENVDQVLKFMKYIFLLLLIIISWSLGLKAFQNANPWDAFGMLFTVGKTPDLSYVISNLAPAFIILVAILAASFYVERFFCRYLCPLGAIFALTSRLRITAIKKPSDKCGSCRVCTKNCPMGIALYKEDKVKSGECINCLQCVSKCPRKNVGFTVVEQDARPILAGALAVSVITGVYYAGSFATDSFASASGSTVANSQTQKLYKDGTYQGSGTGFRNGTTTLSVVVKNGLISDINVISTGDDQQFFNRAFNTIVPEIIKEQDSDVDAVSGATFSSNGIMEAVADALQNAGVSSSTSSSAASTQVTAAATKAASDVTDSASSDKSASSTKNSTESKSTASTSGSTSSSSGQTSTKSADSSSSKTSSSSESNSTSSSGSKTSSSSASKSSSTSSSSSSSTSDSSTQKYKDGTYEGSGIGFRGGTTKVSVTIKNGKITGVTTISTMDDGRFYNSAYQGVVQEIMNAQSANVDAVSGATYSSNGIMEAVADALNQAE